MTETTRTPAAAPAAFPIGPSVGMAESALSRLLAGVLAETGTPRQTYLALQRIAALGEQATRDEYVADLSEWLDLDQAQATELADSLVGSGLLTITGETVRLSESGTALRARIGESIGVVTARLYAQFDPADLATTVRTRQAITTRAKAMR
jgi:DNA-binding MarR family transcriptional regulator